MTKTLEEKARFIQLRAQGLSFDSIAEEMQVSKPTLLKWQGEFYEEVKQAQFHEFDNLLNQFQVHRNKRFENNCRLLNACYAELENRIEQLEELSVPELQKLVEQLEKKIEAETARATIEVEVPSNYSFEMKEPLEL